MISFSFFDLGFYLIMILLIVFSCVIIQRKHFIMVLLCLELMMLFFFFCIFFFSSFFSSDVYCSMILLCFSVCEASVGLSLLVSFIRSHGIDFISVISIYECY